MIWTTAEQLTKVRWLVSWKQFIPWLMEMWLEQFVVEPKKRHLNMPKGKYLLFHQSSIASIALGQFLISLLNVVLGSNSKSQTFSNDLDLFHVIRLKVVLSYRHWWGRKSYRKRVFAGKRQIKRIFNVLSFDYPDLHAT